MKTIGTPSVSGPSQPAKAAPSVEYSPSKLGEMKTVTDGNTTVQSNWSSDQRDRFHQTTGQWPPCINTSCKSYGKPHPNCLCYPGHSDENDSYAKGGCVGAHKEKCEHFATGGEIAQNELLQNHPQDALDHVAVQHGLLHLLTKVGHSKSEDPHKHLTDYLDNARKGHRSVKGKMQSLLGAQKGERMDADKSSVEALKSHLQHLQEHPEDMLNIGGSLGDNLPHHAVQLAAQAAGATSYLKGLKPSRMQTSPLDNPEPPDKMAENHYDRHLSLAQDPMLIVQHIKDGTLRPDDVTTIHTLYPGLSKSLAQKSFEQLVEAKQKGVEIPYKQKQSLSTFLGQPLDSSMTPASMQAIMASAGPQQMQNQAKTQPKSKKASGVELKQINKVNSMYATPLEQRELDKKD